MEKDRLRPVFLYLPPHCDRAFALTTMSIVVYWLTPEGPCVQPFADTELMAALAFAEARRKDRDAHGQPCHRHVVINTELGDSVGQAGVSDAPPDYHWTKSHRGGPPESGNPPKTLA